MSKKIIAVDIDDVLAAGAQGFVDFSNKTFGTKLTIEEYDERWAIMWGVDHEEEVKRATVIYQEGAVRHFEPIESAREVLLKLKNKYKLVIVTSRVKKIQPYTEEWINKYFESIFEDIHFAGFYDELNPRSHKHTKAELLSSIGADYLIDDHPKHCLASAEAGIIAILFGDYPWSRGVSINANMHRALNWAEVEQYFDEQY